MSDTGGGATDIIIRVNENGTPIVTRRMQDLDKSIRGADASILSFHRAMQTALGTMKMFMGALGLNMLREYADHWIQIQNKIRVFTSSLEEAKTVHLELYKVVQESRQEFDPMVQLYSRSAQAAGTLGATQRQLIDFTEGVAKALAIQGVSTTNARGALLQLGQAMGMAKLRAQEFNSINEQAPIILQTIAKNLYGASGSVAQLRGEMEKGDVRAKQVFESFLTGLPAIRKQFELVKPTIGQSLTVLNNAFGRQIGLMDEHYQITAKISSAFILLANNLDLVGKVLIAISPLFFAFFGTMALNAVRALTLQVLSLGAALVNSLARFPIATIAGGLAGGFLLAGAALYAFRDDIVLARTELDEFRDAAGEKIVIDVTLGDYASTMWDDLWDGLTLAKYFDKSIIMLSSSWNEFCDTATKEWNQFITTISMMINTFVRAFLITTAYLWKEWSYFCTYMELNFRKAIQAVLDGLDSFIKGFNNISSYVFMPEIPTLDINMDVDAYERGLVKIEDDYKKTYDELKNYNLIDIGDPSQSLMGQATGIGEFDKIKQTFTSRMEELNKDAAKLAQERFRKQQLGNGVNLDAPPEKIDPYESSKGKKDRTMQKLENELRSLMRTLDPVKFAALDLAKAEDTLTRAQQKGLITLAEKNKYMAKLPEHFEKLAQPYEFMLLEMQRESAYLQVNIQDQETYKTVLSQVLSLKQSGVEVSAKQVEHLANEAKQTKYLTEVNEKLNSIYQESAGYRTEQMAQNVTAAYMAFDKGIISSEQFINNLARINIELGQIGTTAGEFEIIGFFSGAMAGVMENYTNIVQGLQNTLSDAYASMADGFANSIGRAIVYGDSLKESIVGIAKSITVDLISSLIKLGIQYVINAALSQQMAVGQLAASAIIAKSTATAWAPAAAMVSLATSGANSVPAMAGISATNMLSLATALTGFKTGGFTGNMGVNDVAGVVHGKEYVFDAESVSRIGLQNLENLRSGKPVSNNAVNTTANGGTSNAPNITVVNHNYVNGTGDEALSAAIDTAVERATTNSVNSIIQDFAVNGPARQMLREG